MNDMERLTFSCDGSHYMSVAEFLRHDIGFWLGTTTGAQPVARAVN